MKINYAQALQAVLLALVTGSTSFTVGGSQGLQVSVALSSGQPVHLTFAAALAAVVNIAAGKTGTFPIGSIVITITDLMTSTPAT